MKFQGILTALVTPFKDNQVDRSSLKNLLKHQMDGQVQGLVVMGTTAESPTLTPNEKKQVFEQVQSEISGQVPVVVGVGSNNTMQTIANAKQATDWGADALLCVVPYYNKPPQRGLVHHFQQVSQAVPDTPIILYNVPSRTITSLKLETIQTLAECPNIVGIKDASGDMTFDRTLISTLADKKFDILSGDDHSFDFFMELGGSGLISVISNVLPADTVVVYQAYSKGKTQAGRMAFQKLLPYLDWLSFDTNPIPIKFALYLEQIIATPDVRSPLAVPDHKTLENLKLAWRDGVSD